MDFLDPLLPLVTRCHLAQSGIADGEILDSRWGFVGLMGFSPQAKKKCQGIRMSGDFAGFLLLSPNSLGFVMQTLCDCESRGDAAAGSERHNTWATD